jgi:hypothetical protein
MCGRRGDCKQLFRPNQKLKKRVGQRNQHELQWEESGSN